MIMKTLHPPKNLAQNYGFILPVALILLLVSTLLGVTALRVNSLSEKMTLNTIQREEAFARAEAALLEGELLVRDNAVAIFTAIFEIPAADNCAAVFNGSPGLCSPASNPQTPNAVPNAIERWETILFPPSTSTNVRTTPDGTRYIIEFMGHIIGTNTDGSNNSLCADVGSDVNTVWPYCEFDPFQFRITALAMGDEANAGLVMLQSVYVASPIPLP